ncbi:MAG: hypothetical protein ACRDZU_08845 [Acidimicrobiales bacterium]
MAASLARSARQRRAAILSIALAAGGIAFVYATGDDGGPDDGPGAPATSGASVLGVVVTQDALPIAPPASPATFSDSDDASTTLQPPSSSTSRPPATLVPPTVIENTTSTTRSTTPSTIDLSTTTTEPTTTTEIPPG